MSEATTRWVYCGKQSMIVADDAAHAMNLAGMGKAEFERLYPHSYQTMLSPDEMESGVITFEAFDRSSATRMVWRGGKFVAARKAKSPKKSKGALRKRTAKRTPKAAKASVIATPSDVDSPAMLNELLRAEKERRGVPAERVVFVGIANVAKYWWCAEFAAAKCRANELEFFSAYRHLVLSNARRRGLIGESAPPDLRPYAQALTREDAEAGLRPLIEAHDVAGAQGLPARDHDRLSAEVDGKRGMRAGKFAEQLHAEPHASLMWQWEWDAYVLLGIPDGITDQLVYEFKSTWNEFMRGMNLPVARAQADLYGHFWQRPQKRIQFYLRQTGTIETFEEPVDPANAIRTLELFKAVEQGQVPKPPREWKCRNCEFASTCPIRLAPSR
jgi:hypothetical protein